MSDSTNLQRRIKTLDASTEFDGYSKVVLTVSDDVEYTSGTDTGRTLFVECPWGTQQMADDILSRIQGYQYQPYTASGALLDPAAELGDAVTVGSIYGGIYSKSVTLGRLYSADISAPGDEKINYEFPYVSAQDRKVSRELYNLSAELTVQAGLISAEVTDRKSDVESLNALLAVQADEISAKVSKTGGSSSSFGWTLTDSSWTISANGSTVLSATKSGLEVNGKITATSGKIGGFTINSTYLSYNSQTWGGTNSTGIYIGTSGIQLGKNFKVDSSGNLTAASGTFTGSVYAGNILYGSSYGTLDGSALSSHSVYGSQIGYSTITTSYTSSGINTSLGYADYAHGVFNGYYYASTIGASSMHLGSYDMGWTTISYLDANGNARSLRVISGQ